MREGYFDNDTVTHYHKVIDALKEAHIEPMITLHHFTEPLWFTELGGFQKMENIEFFVRFCKFVFTEYQSKVKKWCTINEPSIYSMYPLSPLSLSSLSFVFLSSFSRSLFPSHPQCQTLSISISIHSLNFMFSHIHSTLSFSHFLVKIIISYSRFCSYYSVEVWVIIWECSRLQREVSRRHCVFSLFFSKHTFAFITPSNICPEVLTHKLELFTSTHISSL